MDITKLMESWKVGAEKDWIAAQHLYENKDYPQSLFWGHLVLEKILKALVVKVQKKQSPYTHDLVSLAKLADLILSQQRRDQLNEINTFNQFGRYDNQIMTFLEKCTEEYAKKYFTIIQQLYLWLKGNFRENK